MLEPEGPVDLTRRVAPDSRSEQGPRDSLGANDRRTQADCERGHDQRQVHDPALVEGAIAWIEGAGERSWDQEQRHHR